MHPGGVYALSKTKKESIVSAGKDGVISEWNAEDLVRVRRPADVSFRVRARIFKSSLDIVLLCSFLKVKKKQKNEKTLATRRLWSASANTSALWSILFVDLQQFVARWNFRGRV